MKELHELKETLCNELKEYGRKGKISTGELDIVDKLTHTIKNLDKIIEKYDDDYSSAYSYRGGYSNRYDDGHYSMARGRNARRDAIGRYSRNNDMMIQELRELMEDAPDERTKMEFQQFINKMEKM